MISFRLNSFAKIAAVLVVALAATSCSDVTEPTYKNTTSITLNYTPLNIVNVVVSDKYGNKLFGSDPGPGGGEGAFNCCYSLKGREMQISWQTYDRATYPKMEAKTATASVAEENSSSKKKYLHIHIFPDDHVELVHSSKMLGVSKIDFFEIDRQLMMLPEFQNKNPSEFMFISAQVIGDAWKKYKFTETSDLVEYVYTALAVHPRFDEHPAIAQNIRDSQGKPGAFAASMKKLDAVTMKDLKSNGLKYRRPALELSDVRK
nr:hypothetical protein [uncultured Caldimonas sp.]